LHPPHPPQAGAQHRLAAASNSHQQDRGMHLPAPLHLNRTKSGAPAGGCGVVQDRLFGGGGVICMWKWPPRPH
jgi:hypothetical protein